MMDHRPKPELTCAEPILLQALWDPSLFKARHGADYNILSVAKHSASHTPKVIAGISAGEIKIAIGFGGDDHSEIADKAFGQGWLSKFSSYGGGKLSIDFKKGTVVIYDYSQTLGNRAVPREICPAVTAKIQEVVGRLK